MRRLVWLNYEDIVTLRVVVELAEVAVSEYRGVWSDRGIKEAETAIARVKKRILKSVRN